MFLGTDKEIPLSPGVPVAMAALVAVFPVIIAIFSRRVTIVLSSLALAALAFIVFERPSLAGQAVVAVALVGEAIVAVAGIASRRRALLIERELAKLREGHRELVLSEERRRMLELKTGARGSKFGKEEDADRQS